MSRVGLARLLVVIIGIGALEVAVRLGIVPRTVIIAPSEMLRQLWSIAVSGRLWQLSRGTMLTVSLAIGLSLVGGTLLGLALHAWPRLRRALDPLLASYYAVPIFVFYPVLIVLFGIGPLPLVGIGSAFGIIVIAFSIVQGLEHMPTAIAKMARVERMGAIETFWSVQRPFLIPYVAHGLKLAVAYAFVGVIGGEFILAPAGLGHAIAFAYNDFDNPTMYALMLFVILVVTTINLSLHGLETRVRRRRGLT